MKYEVYFEKIFTLNLSVEAENKEEAREKVEKVLNEKGGDALLEQCQQGYFEYIDTEEVEE